MDTTISYQRLWELFKKNFFLLIISALVLAAVAYAGSRFLIHPKYQSTAALLVNRSNNTDPNAALGNQQADIQIIYTYRDLATRPVILDQVARNLRGRYPDISSSSLASMVTVSSVQNSQIFSISARSNDPVESRDIANMTADVFKTKAVQVMGKSISNVSIVSRGLRQDTPVSPNVRLFTLAGFLLGVFIVVLFVLIKEMSDNTYRDLSFLEQLKLNNLGTVNYASFHKGRAK
ncbi:YveK family protein [Oenococcus kitaharae]|uniref:Capsular polysaccharide biosynthesis protein CpsC n=1 Tax=Oenococcus kitaharae DSM 17330 TaxID=1045004 RepID=G9WIR0_9LACO|nr:Wzz/FepE/Etk N-terminal domain-containing protein [Oenococcus kitaharae]EHN58199.1 Tyrosine-protein kinase transmembrane modulator EpsC [Oenococcus kitaharae DSM 17330]OEY81612.1 capsular biosynthesis protein [Oenococcus kitaharae]OEY83097.1 capsular biosynthesis protein [Oenococcus kitaharae]OEY84357.1 capsular biosynthesis protein [Oenococcus kitaharae]